MWSILRGVQTRLATMEEVSGAQFRIRHQIPQFPGSSPQKQHPFKNFKNSVKEIIKFHVIVPLTPAGNLANHFQSRVALYATLLKYLDLQQLNRRHLLASRNRQNPQIWQCKYFSTYYLLEPSSQLDYSSWKRRKLT